MYVKVFIKIIVLFFWIYYKNLRKKVNKNVYDKDQFYMTKPRHVKMNEGDFSFIQFATLLNRHVTSGPFVSLNFKL